ncbi:hypothetical protein GCM10010319_08610 [Streptomyces blastmyceticus]|uniref:Uncharacterized protein n=1 Tax=Streptomyces blastmyceticus TaxID=68180 RepID=A0ABN0WES1_9ACTN
MITPRGTAATATERGRGAGSADGVRARLRPLTDRAFTSPSHMPLHGQAVQREYPLQVDGLSKDRRSASGWHGAARPGGPLHTDDDRADRADPRARADDAEGRRPALEGHGPGPIPQATSSRPDLSPRGFVHPW